jgi:hypothetical protein
MTQAINVDLNANDSGSQSAFKRLEASINGSIERLTKMEGQAQRSGRAIIDAMTKASTAANAYGRAGGNVASIIGDVDRKTNRTTASSVAGWVAAVAGVGGYVSSLDELMGKIEEAGLKHDDMARKFAVQAGKSGLDRSLDQERIGNVAYSTASTMMEASAIGTELASSGFSAKDATGDALAVALKAQAAMGEQGSGKGPEVVRAASRAMQAMGMEQNAGNLGRVLMAVQQAGKAGFMKFDDLGKVSGKVSGFAGKASMEELLSAYAVGLKTMDAENASTGLKIFGSRTMGAGRDVQRKQLLAEIGMKPEDVDFVGEGLDTVTNRLAKGIGSLPAAKRTSWEKKFFGDEGADFAHNLLTDRASMQDFRNVMTNREGFEADAKEMTTGKAAADRRLSLRREMLLAARDRNAKQKADAADVVAMESGQSDFERWVNSNAMKGAMFLGASPDTAASIAYDLGGVSPARANARQVELDRAMGTIPSDTAVAGALQRQNTLMEQQNELLKKIAGNTGKEPVRIEKPDVPKTPISVYAGRGKRY